MATGKGCYGRSNYRFLSGHPNSFTSDLSFELNESDIFNSGSLMSPEIRRSPMPGTRISKKASSKAGESGGVASSLPVNIPDWSKILKEEYREKRSFEYDGDLEEDEEDLEEMRVPPHEYLARQTARTRRASFSVQEGIGRTLKGRDLSRVRNAIWEKIGFED